jgi:uncharacterized protein YegP (UPF0339 family)
VTKFVVSPATFGDAKWKWTLWEKAGSGWAAIASGLDPYQTKAEAKAGVAKFRKAVATAKLFVRKA